MLRMELFPVLVWPRSLLPFSKRSLLIYTIVNVCCLKAQLSLSWLCDRFAYFTRYFLTSSLFCDLWLTVWWIRCKSDGRRGANQRIKWVMMTHSFSSSQPCRYADLRVTNRICVCCTDNSMPKAEASSIRVKTTRCWSVVSLVYRIQVYSRWSPRRRHCTPIPYLRVYSTYQSKSYHFDPVWRNLFFAIFKNFAQP